MTKLYVVCVRAIEAQARMMMMRMMSHVTKSIVDGIAASEEQENEHTDREIGKQSSRPR